MKNISEPIYKKEEEVFTREVPKSSKPESRCLLITNLQRPFSPNSLEELLNKTGHVQRFWHDFIKTHCYVEYKTIEESKLTRDSLYNTIWPVDGKKMIVEYANESDITYSIDKNQSPYALSQDKEKLNIKKIIPRGSEGVVGSNNELSGREYVAKIEEPIKTLDNLFRKTNTKPHIYFLPLSEEEVHEKKLKLKIIK